MGKARSPRFAGVRSSGSPDEYFRLSTRPLHVLAFLLPLIVLYEVGSILYLSDPSRGTLETIGARNILFRFFDAFGGATLYLPGIAMAVVLVIWHLLEKDRWRLKAKVLGGMAAESVAWTLPLIVLGLLLAHGPSAPNPGPPVAMAQQSAPEAISHLPWQARLTLSIGAGLYEELLFRLILIAGLHFVLVDLARLKERPAAFLSAGASALAFTMYHDVAIAGRGIDAQLVTFLVLAGLYFAALFIVRGFGIVVAVHALYDMVALIGIGSGRGSG